MEKVEEREKLSDKTLKLLKDLEEKLLKQFTHITTSLQADSFFKNVRADGLGLNAGLETEGTQMIRLRIRRAVEEVPEEILDKAKKYAAMDIVLSGAEGEMQPRLPIRISMDIPEGLGREKLVIYHCHDGEIHVIHPVVKGNRMSFDVWELSMFVAANTKDDVILPVLAKTAERMEMLTRVRASLFLENGRKMIPAGGMRKRPEDILAGPGQELMDCGIILMNRDI